MGHVCQYCPYRAHRWCPNQRLNQPASCTRLRVCNRLSAHAPGLRRVWRLRSCTYSRLMATKTNADVGIPTGRSCQCCCAMHGRPSCVCPLVAQQSVALPSSTPGSLEPALRRSSYRNDLLGSNASSHHVPAPHDDVAASGSAAPRRSHA
jgi:hypothetical protein